MVLLQFFKQFLEFSCNDTIVDDFCSVGLHFLRILLTFSRLSNYILLFAHVLGHVRNLIGIVKDLCEEVKLLRSETPRAADTIDSLPISLPISCMEELTNLNTLMMDGNVFISYVSTLTNSCLRYVHPHDKVTLDIIGD